MLASQARPPSASAHRVCSHAEDRRRAIAAVGWHGAHAASLAIAWCSSARWLSEPYGKLHSCRFQSPSAPRFASSVRVHSAIDSGLGNKVKAPSAHALHARHAHCHRHAAKSRGDTWQ